MSYGTLTRKHSLQLSTKEYGREKKEVRLRFCEREERGGNDLGAKKEKKEFLLLPSLRRSQK